MTLLSVVASGNDIRTPFLRYDVWQNQANAVNLRIIIGGQFYASPTATKTVSGHFKDETGAGIARNGYALDRATGVLIATFTSAGTGAFTFGTPNGNPVIIVLVPNLGDGRNAIALDNIVPI